MILQQQEMMKNEKDNNSNTTSESDSVHSSQLQFEFRIHHLVVSTAHTI